MKKKHQKPIEFDIHLKYRCTKCSQDHWLSYKEAQTKNFKVVCDCGRVFKVKRVKSFLLKYHSLTIEPKQKDKKVIDNAILENCAKSLIGYGFTKSEAIDLIHKAYDKNPTNDCGLLVKESLLLLRN